MQTPFLRKNLGLILLSFLVLPSKAADTKQEEKPVEKYNKNKVALVGTCVGSVAVIGSLITYKYLGSKKATFKHPYESLTLGQKKEFVEARKRVADIDAAGKQRGDYTFMDSGLSDALHKVHIELFLKNNKSTIEQKLSPQAKTEYAVLMLNRDFSGDLENYPALREELGTLFGDAAEKDWNEYLEKCFN